MKPSAWVVAALCLYLLLEAALDTRSGYKAHPHSSMVIAVTLTLVLERADTLAELRLEKVVWDEAKRLSLQDLLKAAYLDGVRDTVDYLEYLSEDSAEA